MAFDIKSLAKFLPTVEKPTFKHSLNQKLKWTGLVLIIYFMLSSTLFGSVYGVNPQAVVGFQTLQILLGSSFGTLMTLGIGPIVTASILLQLLVGSKIISWDLKKKEDKEKFQTTQKIVSIAFAFIEAVVYVVAGAVQPVSFDVFTVSIVVFQLALGGVIVILLDEIVSKHGIGSGISLFIAAGVINTVFIQVLSPCVPVATGGCPLPSSGVEPVGRLWSLILNIGSGFSYQTLSSLIPLVSTVVVILIVVYAQSITIDIPLTFSQVRGFGRRWSLNLFYTSNIPVILAAALIANMQLFANLLAQPLPDDPNVKCGILGCMVSSGGFGSTAASGPIYYLSAPQGNVILDIIGGTFTTRLLLKIITYTIFLTAGAIIFSVFWVKTSGMDSESVAKQIDSVGLQIPGYRKDPKVIKSVLDRYIPPLSVIGGASIGLLAALADILGAFGSGTGILLTVTILYNFYQQLKQEEVEGAHPLVRKVIGE